jgi:hypothetical protein
MVPDADELVLFEGSRVVGDTFIFEPASGEVKLGWLYAVAETEKMDHAGKEIVDTVVQALQREYYRDPARGVLASFESALHQANLILHDLVEQGVREWMGSFHVAVAALAGANKHAGENNEVPHMTLHVSTAGEGIVLLSRAQKLTLLSAGMSHSPILDPLRTFSSVASGLINERDVIFIGTSNFDQVYRSEDLARFVADQSAETIAMQLRQLFEDQKRPLPVAALVIAVSPDQTGRQGRSVSTAVNRQPISMATGLTPRKPLIISRSIGKKVILLIGKLAVYAGKQAKQVIWPYVKEGSRRSGKALFNVSKTAGRSVQSLKNKNFNKNSLAMDTGKKGKWFTVRNAGWKVVASNLFRAVIASVRKLPRSSKIFGVTALLLTMLLGISVVLLQQKRAADEQIQQASEFLHEARTKKEAAETALIYDNRDQARTLLADAKQLIDRIQLSGLYREQVAELAAGITAVQDRLDKVTRVAKEETTVVGDLGTVITGQTPTKIFYVNGVLYSFDAASNVIVRIGENGAAEKVSKNTSGIGFFTVGSTQEADKNLVLATDEPGLAIYDIKMEVLQKQEVQMPSEQSVVVAVATFGNRVYLYDSAMGNIYGYSKTLRGYSGGNPWVTSTTFPRNNVIDMGVDGYVYTLHSDGVIRKLLKGEEVDFEMDQVEPNVSDQASMEINENLRHIYVLDPVNKRVVIWDTVGHLIRQVFLGEESNAKDIAVSEDELKLYVLDGTKILAISLEE